MPLPKSAAAATRCSGDGSSSGDDRHPQADPVRRRAGLAELAPHEAVLDALCCGTPSYGSSEPITARRAVLRPGGSVAGCSGTVERFVRMPSATAVATRVAVVFDASLGDADLAAVARQPRGDVQRRDRHRSQQLDGEPRGRQRARAAARPRSRAGAADRPAVQRVRIPGPRARSVGSQASRRPGTNSELTARRFTASATRRRRRRVDRAEVEHRRGRPRHGR